MKRDRIIEDLHAYGDFIEDTTRSSRSIATTESPCVRERNDVLAGYDPVKAKKFCVCAFFVSNMNTKMTTLEEL